MINHRRNRPRHEIFIDAVIKSVFIALITLVIVIAFVWALNREAEAYEAHYGIEALCEQNVMPCDVNRHGQIIAGGVIYGRQ